MSASPNNRDRASSEPFWKRKTLAQMTRREWESLCDGCGKCCLVKIEDVDTGEVRHTDAACRLLNLHTCRCGDYRNRTRRVADCVKLTPEEVDGCDWLPSTCAYRLVAEGEDLPQWHPLVSGDRRSVHRAGISVRHRAVKETQVDDLEAHVVHWAK